MHINDTCYRIHIPITTIRICHTRENHPTYTFSTFSCLLPYCNTHWVSIYVYCMYIYVYTPPHELSNARICSWQVILNSNEFIFAYMTQMHIHICKIKCMVEKKKQNCMMTATCVHTRIYLHHVTNICIKLLTFVPLYPWDELIKLINISQFFIHF